VFILITFFLLTLNKDLKERSISTQEKERHQYFFRRDNKSYPSFMQSFSVTVHGSRFKGWGICGFRILKNEAEVLRRTMG